MLNWCMPHLIRKIKECVAYYLQEKSTRTNWPAKELNWSKNSQKVFHQRGKIQEHIWKYINKNWEFKKTKAVKKVSYEKI